MGTIEEQTHGKLVVKDPLMTSEVLEDVPDLTALLNGFAELLHVRLEFLRPER